MDKDDDDAEDTSMNVVRFPIMPSLVALQTMRNRLHLAHLGKKLMKWTALATGKELRRISYEIAGLLKDYGVRLREAFMYLARCRYQLPPMNIIALECCPEIARLTVTKTTRSVAGVKVKSLGVVESGPDGYSFLGLGRAGEIIRETKKAWYELLKIMVLLAQFRITFAMIDEANKAANKKQNVLQRMIVPRINLTMRYILSELDEQEREESFRLKRFKQLKYKYAKKPEGLQSIEEKKEEEIQIVGQEQGDIEIAAEEKEEVPEPRTEIEPEPKPELEPEPKPELEPEPKLEPVPEPKPKLEPVPIPEPEPEPEPELPKPQPTDEELIIEHMHEVVRLAEIIQNAALIQQNFGLTRCDLGKLKGQLHETLKLSQTSKEHRECIKCAASQCHCPASLNPPIPPSNENVEVLRPPGYENALKLMPTKKVATPMPVYIMQPRGKPPGTKIEDEDRLSDLQNHVDQVICLTHCYKQDGVLSKSAENFLKCCQNVKTKIDEIKENKKACAKINRLKWQIEHLEQVTDIIKKEGLPCDAISSFMTCCKDFKTKLECRKVSKGAPSVCSIEKLLERIDVSIELSKEAKIEGLVTESLEEFIGTCKEIKAKIDTQDEETKPKVINDLRGNLNEIMKCILKYKQGGLFSESIEKFYTSCESTKAKLDDYKLPPCIKCQMTRSVSEHSNIPKKNEKNEICPSCQEPDNNSKISYTKFASICPSCNRSFSPEEESDPGSAILCPVCSRHGSQDKSSCQEKDTCKCAEKSEPDSAATCKCAEKSEPDSAATCKCAEKSEPDSAATCKCAEKSEPDSAATCKCAEKSEPDSADTCKCSKEKGYCKAKVYEDCPKCMKRLTGSLPFCKTKAKSCKRCEALGSKAKAKSCKTCEALGSKAKAKSCKTCEALGPKNTGTYKTSSETYIASILLKSESCSCISNSSLSYVPQSSYSQTTVQQLTKTYIQMPMQTCKSFQTIALVNTIFKKECDSRSFQTIDLDKTIFKKECDSKSFQTIDLDKTIFKKECDSRSFQTIDLDKTIFKKECDSRSFQTIDLDKTKCKECDDNKDQKEGDTVSMKIMTKFKNIGVNSVKDSNLVPRQLRPCKSVESTEIFCKTTTTKGLIQIVRNIKSEKLILTQDLSDPYSPYAWSDTSAKNLTPQDRNNESNSAQLDPFFCCNSSTSHDNSGPVLPL